MVPWCHIGAMFVNLLAWKVGAAGSARGGLQKGPCCAKHMRETLRFSRANTLLGCRPVCRHAAATRQAFVAAASSCSTQGLAHLSRKSRLQAREPKRGPIETCPNLHGIFPVARGPTSLQREASATLRQLDLPAVLSNLQSPVPA